MRSLLVCSLVFAALLAGPASICAEENTWTCEESRTKDILVKLKTGESVRGRFSADTEDKVMIAVTDGKGAKTTQTFLKEDITQHDWIPRMEDEVRDKIKAWPADGFDGLLTYAQDMMSRGQKKTVLEGMKDQQKNLTANGFKLYVFFLLNNECVKEAREVTLWAEQQHAGWQEEIAAVKDRLPAESEGGDAPANSIKPGSAAKTFTGWLTNLEKAKQLSVAQDKPILAFFTGSDWCGWCKKLDAEVFSKPEFKTWATKNVVLLKLDYPKYSTLDNATKTQNEKLQGQYRIGGYPTVLFLDSDGKAYKDKTGYLEGGPEKWLKNADVILDNAKKK